jgi:hypothetical protein
MLAVARIAPSHVVRRALHFYQRIDDVDEQAGMAFTLAPSLAKALPPDAFDHLSDATRHGRQIITLTRMVSQLSSALKGGVLDEFIRDAASMSSEWWIVEALTLTLLRLHDKEQLNSILHAVRNITLPDLRSRLVGRMVLRFARLGYIREALSAVDAAPPEDRWGILSDLSSELASDGLFAEAEEVAAAIAGSEERGRASATIAIHLAASGQVEEARRIAGNIILKHWKEWIYTRLETLEGVPGGQAPPERKRPSASAAAAPPEDPINFESISEAVEAIILQGMITEELYAVRSAAQARDAMTAATTARKFWQVKDERNKTYLDRISEQPRQLFLRELRRAGPLLRLSLREGEAEGISSAVQSVSSWWP